MKTTFFFIILFFCLFYSVLFSETRDWDQLYLMIDRTVSDMKYSNIPGISENGLLFALPGDGGGLAYFTEPDSLLIFTPVVDLGVGSIVPDISNNRIFCAVGGFTPNVGLYRFDLNTQSFETIMWMHYSTCLKRITSGYYYGHFYGLSHSLNGDEWIEIDFFDDMEVTDIEENGDGTVFISTDDAIYIENNGNFNSFDTSLRINDIYIRNYPNDDEVYIACGEFSYSDAVYRVEYENNEITGLTYISGFFQPNRIYEYNNYLVVGCINYFSNLFLVEPVENGEVIEIGSGLGINKALCFEFYPIYTPNFMVGTDIGVFLATNLTSVLDDELIEMNSVSLSKNYPNPFNPTTTISFSIPEESHAELSIYNIKGQKVKQLVSNIRQLPEGQHSVVWDGRDDNSNRVSSGIYFYKLKVGNSYSKTKKMLLLK